MNKHTFFHCQKYAGRWEIGGHDGLSLYQEKRPRALTRLLCRWLLEWVWIDN